MFYVVKCKLHPKKKQAEYFDKNFGCCRFVYNHFLSYSIDHYHKNKDLPDDKREKRPSAYDLMKMIKGLKQEYTWLTEVDSQALKYSVSQVDIAFRNFFRRLKQGEKPGFPRFKSKHKSKKSFTLTQGQRIEYTDNAIILPKIGHVRLDKTNFNPPLNDALLKRCTISQSKSGNYYISILFSDDIPEPDTNHHPDNKITSIDLGLAKLFRAEDSTGYRWDIHSPRILRDNMDKLKREQRRLSRKKFKSNRWKKQKIKVSRIHERIANTRRYFFHLLVNDIMKTCDAMSVEDLKIQKMIDNISKEDINKKRKNINRAFYDQALSELIKIMSYKSRRLGKPFYLIDTLKSPNKICSQCGEINDHVTLQTIMWECKNCNSTHQRSDNCLVNLHRMASEMASEIINNEQP